MDISGGRGRKRIGCRIVRSAGAVILASVPGITNAATPGIQVLEVRDVELVIPVKASNGFLESRDGFCVISPGKNTGVRLHFRNSSGTSPNGQSWLARNIAGSSLSYEQWIEYQDGSGAVEVSRTGNDFFVLNATRVAASAAECEEKRIVKRMRIRTDSPALSAGPYLDVVNVLAAPL
jgi:hypothetical protein